MRAKLVLVLVVTYCLRLAGDCVVVRFGGFVCDLVGLIACVAWVCLSIVFDLDVLLLGLGC